MAKIILVQPEKCVGCFNCALSCSFAHYGVFSLGRANIAPVWFGRIGMSMPMFCQQCTKPLCMDVCPTGAITRNGETGEVVLNSDMCIGCKQCMLVCPFGGISMDPETGNIMKCDLCGGDPECVKHCLYGALEWIDSKDVVDIKRRAGVEKIVEALDKVI